MIASYQDTVDDRLVTLPVRPDSPLPVRGVGDVISVTFSLDTSAYADGDVLGDTQVLADVVRAVGGRALLMGYTLLDKDDVGQTLDLVFLKSSASLGTENAAPNISDANAENILAIGGPANDLRVSSSDYVDVGGTKLVTKVGLMGYLEAAADSRDLYVGAIIRGAGTYTASGLILTVWLSWD